MCGLASSSLKPMMLVSGVRSSYDTWLMNWLLQAVGGDQRLVALDQRPLVALGVGHVGERDQRRAVGQRHHRIVDDVSSGRTIWPLSSLALVGERGDGAADARPGLRIVVQLARLRMISSMCGSSRERAARQLPDLRRRPS